MPAVCDVSHFEPRFPNSSKNMLALKVNGPVERGRFDQPEIADILHWHDYALFCKPSMEDLVYFGVEDGFPGFFPFWMVFPRI